jgi:hypothetical protein
MLSSNSDRRDNGRTSQGKVNTPALAVAPARCPSEHGDAPRMPGGFKTELEKADWH